MTVKNRWLACLAGGLALLVGDRVVADDEVPHTVLCESDEACQHYIAGYRAQRAGNAAGAIERYNQALAIQPELVPAIYELGWSYWTLNDWQQVVSLWERVLAINPDHLEVPEHLPMARENLRLAQLAENGGGSNASPRPPGSRGLRIAALGDLMLATTFRMRREPVGGCEHFLDNIAPIMREADVAFGNLESSVGENLPSWKCATPREHCYSFLTPPRCLDALTTAGIDVVSQANNHAWDHGRAGADIAQAELTERGIAYGGLLGDVASFERQGVSVAMVAVAPNYGTYSALDHEQVASLVSEAAAGHDIVLFSMHVGGEGTTVLGQGMERYLGERRGDPRQLARVAIDNGADLVLGHGPHVPRALEVYNERLIAYSLGNSATVAMNLRFPNNLAPVLVVDLDNEGRFVEGVIHSAIQSYNQAPILDPEHQAFTLMQEVTERDIGAETRPRFEGTDRIYPQ